MKQYVVCVLEIEGFHYWPEAPTEISYLQSTHRHVFSLSVELSVSNGNREIEIITKQNEIRCYLLSRYGDSNGTCQFGPMSCEQIAEDILTHFSASSCIVLEDGYGGAKVVR